MADPHAVEAAAAQAERELGPIDVWVNDAFTTVFAEFTGIGPDEFRRVTEVCYLGYVYGTQSALRRMLPRGHGVVVQVGSALAYRGIPLQSAYCGAKHAVQGWNEAVRCELLHRHSGVSVTMVQLPALNTPQFDWSLNRMPHRTQPVPPIYQPELAARAVVYAAGHPRRREYWVGASTVGTLLANAVAPGLLDRCLARTGYDSQMTDEPKPPAAATTSGNRWTASTGGTSARTAASTNRRHHMRRNHGPHTITPRSRPPESRWSRPPWRYGTACRSAGRRPEGPPRAVDGSIG
ncbi:SDR family oxidoreductase [Streptomyces lasalocidi]